MSSFKQLPTRKNLTIGSRWLARLLAIVALVNFCLVLFDLSYIPWRDFYLQKVPSLTQLYDPIKGIKPHRETQRYLNKVNQLEQLIQTGLQTPQIEESLQELRNLSNEMIADNPFAGANKSGTLEKIKHQMRDRVGKQSAREAFATFWSEPYLSQTNWQQEINFFNTHIRPLIQTNYYRGIGITGKFIDNFWLIDLPFIILFGLEYLVRSFYLSRQIAGLTWLEAMLRRWYDILLLLPFWRWLRVIPVIIRLYQTDLLNLEPVRVQINHDFVTNFAEEITEVVGVRMINQAQKAIQRGDIARWLFRPGTRRPYVNINNTNEVQAITSRLLHLSVYQVLPKIQPDIEALLRHSIESILNESPIYRQLQSVPGVSNLPTQLTERLAKDISQTLYSTLTNFMEDPVAAELSNHLMQNFTEALEVELQKQHNIQEIQSLLVDLLEEIKINYVKTIAEEGVEKTWEESYQIRKIKD
jgi:hypothetical protein